MITEFGNLNDMTLSQYETAVSYFESTIEKIKNDPNIEDSAKQWFITEYGARLKILKENMHDLQEVIEAKRESGFVNERTATFENLGERYRADNSETVFGRVEYVNPDTKFKKVMHVLSIVTGFGLIPTIVKLRKRKKQRLAVEAELSKENLKLGKFMRENKHPYDSIVLTKTEFTDEQKEALLENPREVSRLEAILSSSALSAEERSNVKAHLQALRKFAQDKSIAIDSSILTDSSLATEKDKADKERQSIADKINAVNIDSADDLTTLNNQYQELEKLKSNFKAGTKNKDLKEQIILKQNQIRDKAKSIISSEKGATITAIEGHHTDDGYNKTALETSNANIKTDIQTNLGVNIDELISITANLGISSDADLQEILNSYNEIKEENDDRLKPFVDTQTFKTKVSELDELSTRLSSAIAGATDPSVWANINNDFEKAKALLQEIKTTAAEKGLNPSDFAEFNTAQSKFDAVEKEIDKKKATSIESSQSELITEHKDNINMAIDYSSASIESLEEARLKVSEARAFFSSSDTRFIYKNLHTESELLAIISNADKKIAAIEDMLKVKSYDTYFITNQSKLDDSSISEDEKKQLFKILKGYKNELESIKAKGLIPASALDTVITKYDNVLTMHSATLGGA